MNRGKALMMLVVGTIVQSVVGVESMASEGFRVQNTGSELIAKITLTPGMDVVLRLPARSGAEQEIAEATIEAARKIPFQNYVGRIMPCGEVARVANELIQRQCRTEPTGCNISAVTLDQIIITGGRFADRNL